MMRAAESSWASALVVWLVHATLLLAQGPATVAPVPIVRRGILYMINGAGGFEVSSRVVSKTIAEAHLPIEVRWFRWSHGFCRIAADQMHVSHMQQEGQKLAEEIMACRRQAPDQVIYLIGHSAGCGVVLTAAELLPPKTLERIILLAPALSCHHDLRPALRSSCQGIDVFTSNRDWACLGLGTLLFGTTDRSWEYGAAGKVGFEPIVSCPEDAVLYTKLRQYPWHPSMSWTGHKGGHYGSYQPGFLHACVVPLLHPGPAQVAPPTR